MHTIRCGRFFEGDANPLPPAALRGRLAVRTLATYAPARHRFRGQALVPVTGPDLKGTVWGVMLPLGASDFSVMLLPEFPRDIPAEAEEAAGLDGVGELRMPEQVALPLGKPAIGVGGVRGFITSPTATRPCATPTASTSRSRRGSSSASSWNTAPVGLGEAPGGEARLDRPTAAAKGVEVACLDTQGKLLGRPVSDLFGGKVRDSGPDDWGEALDRAGIVEQAWLMQQQYGFRSFKLKGGAFRSAEDLTVWHP